MRQLLSIHLGILVLGLASLPAAPAHAGNAMPTRAPVAQSAVFDEAGRLWRVRLAEGRLVVDVSEDRGGHFSSPVPVAPPAEPVAAEGELRPDIAVHDGRIYVAWTSPLPTPYAGNVRFARSLDGGKTFAPPITVNDNREAITHRFQSLQVAPDGQITLVWIDKRDLEAAKRAGRNYRGAAIYYAVSTDGGNSFSVNARLADHSCECCRIALAVGGDGRPVAFWRHVFPDGTRDHALASVAGVDVEPERATAQRWKVDACPHHGPALAIAADGTRYGAWFNQAGGEPGLYYGSWDRDGKALGEPMRFGAANAAHPALLALGRQVLLAWKAFDGQRTVVNVMESEDAGKSFSSPRCVAATADASDHPQLVAYRGQAFLSWATTAEGYRLLPLGGAKDDAK